MSYWRKHVENAQTLLDQALVRGDVPAKVLDCLYDVVLEVTQAVMALERKPDEKKYP